MNILFLGDIVGRPGRTSVARWLPKLRRTHPIDFVVANAENAAGGTGATPDVLDELKRHGVEAFTMGNHVWSKKNLLAALARFPEMARPANYPDGAPGQGAIIVETSKGVKVGLLNLLGRVYMDPLDCPFRAADRALEALRAETPIVLVDMHAEATSEKIAMGWYLDGRCSAVLGVDRNIIIDRFLSGMPARFELAKGPLVLSAVLLEVDEATGRARHIERICMRESDADANA
jgi:metallophosphoesterase (TIGR00282 family)